PDPIFEAAERTARRLGVSRSELYANAVAEFVAHHRRQGITEKLNEIYSVDEALSALDLHLASLQSRSLVKDEW
ncbi:MAG: hypothetical protein A2W28_08985, partial [Gammaproteobacteria bacterium RBG_16_51_14]